MALADRSRVPSLDGLRAVSIALVTFSHLLGTTGFPLAEDALESLNDIGFLGVRTFFVISGYLITNLLISEHAKTGRISLRGFYVRRAYRILPAATVLIAFVAIVAAAGGFQLHRHDLLHAVTYTMNYHYDRSWELGHLWSLSVEEQFYLLWPLALVVFGRRAIVPVAVTMLALAPVFRALAYRYLTDGDSAVDEAFPCVMDAIAAGCLLAGMRTQLDTSRVYRWFTSGPGFLVVLAAIAAAQIRTNYVMLDSVIDVSVKNVALAIVIDRFVRYPDGPAGKVLNWRPVMFVGTLSYSLYLWQEPFINPHVQNATTQWPVNVILAIGCSVASYFLVEKPFLALRKRRSRAS
jgi:peptidoglycan/LPS O-acetylase OafA/YrhL